MKKCIPYGASIALVLLWALVFRPDIVTFSQAAFGVILFTYLLTEWRKDHRRGGRTHSRSKKT